MKKSNPVVGRAPETDKMNALTFSRVCSMIHANKDDDRRSLGRKIVDHLAPPRFTDTISPNRTKVRSRDVREAVFAGDDGGCCHPFTLLLRAHIRLDSHVPGNLPVQLCEAFRGTANFRRRMLVAYIVMGMLFDGFHVSQETCCRLCERV